MPKHYDSHKVPPKGSKGIIFDQRRGDKVKTNKFLINIDEVKRKAKQYKNILKHLRKGK